MGGDVKDLLLLDVTPLSMGIETLGGVYTRIIERNTTLPTSKTQVFSTAADNQTVVEIHALQGERSMAKDNKTLGKFQLTGIPPAPRGVPQIEVAFNIDSNGILDISARDKGTNLEQSVTISNTGGLSTLEVERMRQEALAYAEEDRNRQRLADVRNQADGLLYNYDATLSDGGGRLEPGLRDRLEASAIQLKQYISREDVGIAPLQQSMDELRALLMEAGTAIFGQ